eukprot:XP_011435870.1 PREDICTED: uncharacterized protein LOC105334201 [Crassostrea gigas]
MVNYIFSCVLVSILSILDASFAVHVEVCDNEHKRDEIIKGFSHLVHDANNAELNASKDFYADMLLYALQNKQPPQAIPAKRAHVHIDHHFSDKLEHYRKDMLHHMNLICVSQILWELENILGYPHEVATVATQPTHHVTHAKTTTTTRHTTATTTTTTPIPTTTLPMLNVSAACDPLLFVRALATGVPLTHPDAGICTDNMHSQSEALLLRTCEASSPSTWTQGVNVMQNCAQIPKYTPVATFLFGQYVSDGTVLSGVFLKCTATGFEISVQICGHGPQIFELSSTSGNTRQNADSYYIVEW